MRLAPFTVIIGLLFAAFLVSGCGPTREEDAEYRAIFEDMQAGRFDELEARLVPRIKTADAREVLEKFRQAIPQEAPATVQRLHWGVIYSGDYRFRTSIHQYDYSDRILLFTATLVDKEGAAPLIDFIGVKSIDPEAARANTFALEGKSATHFAALALMVITAALMVLAFFSAVLTKGLKLKWLWAVIALFGAPAFVLNWATGEFGVRLSVNLINAFVTRGPLPLDPWLVSFQLPVGAVLTLLVVFAHWERAKPIARPPENGP